MQIRKILLHNPSEPLFAAHLPLHKGGFGAVQLMKMYIFLQGMAKEPPLRFLFLYALTESSWQ